MQNVHDHFPKKLLENMCVSFITLHPTIFPKNEYTTHIHHIFAALIITILAQSNTLSIVFFFCR